MTEEAFVALTAPHRRALHLHCYRLLGCLHDAEDALQETLLRAWRGIDAYEPRAPLGAWLHRIATNVCLRMLETRSRREVEPYPDRYLDELSSGDDPYHDVEQRELIGLAYIAAMHALPPRQRTVLVLREALDWSAKETAEAIGGTVASVNSALQRAREGLREGDAKRHRTDPVEERRVMSAFQEAWAAVDIEAIVALLADDAVMTMPPAPGRWEGAETLGHFFATEPMQGRLDTIALRPARANGQPALAAYAEGEAYGVMVFAIQGDRIAGITGFAQMPHLFDHLGLPRSLGAGYSRAM
jgi:RNA polymerase sigma-70 factor (ECF subfamily)